MRRPTVPLLALAIVLTLPAGVTAHPDDLPVDAHELTDAVAASHPDSPDEHSDNMELVGNLPYSQGSDLAFWGRTAIAGIFGNTPTDNPGGFRVIDIGDPTTPTQLGRFECHGPQSDVSIWRNLVFVSVDSPRAGPGCDQTGSGTWEGIRVVDISDPSTPTQVAAVETDCGSHTHTLVPDLDNTAGGRRDPRVLLYVQSYPLGAPTASCNVLSHRKISVVEVPLRRPQEARVISTPDVSPAIGCHDTTVFPTEGIAASACITESQIWDISDPVNPEVIAHIYNPAINIHHSTTFDFDAQTLVIGDELGGAAVSPGCMTEGHAPLGALWFYDVTDPGSPSPVGYFVIPQNEEPTQICTAHNFNTIPLANDRDILVSAWYFGGTTVVDYTDPANPEQIGYYEPEANPDTGQGEAEHWSSYWYNGLIYGNNFQTNRGLDVFRIREPALREAIRVPHLNPQTQIPPAVQPRG
ncbi:MAG: LVIVD repeat-containing protein [Actinomycetota bacterium]